MSGDVQPRKRKDKKRRKDEGDQILTQPIHAPIPTNPVIDDVNIHVHKEGGTGGGICAKLVFFVLLSALVMVIGMIITQYRGLNDIDTVDTESKFAQIFEGWIDTSHRHDDHEIDAMEEHEDDAENVSEDDDEDHEASEEEEEDENKELSEENNEDEDDESQADDEDEDEDEEPVVDQSEENPVEESEENSLGEGSEEKETYGDDESEEKEEVDEDEEDEPDHDEDEQELENIASDEANDEGDLADEQDSTEKASKEDEGDDDEEDKLDEVDESDEKISATVKTVEKRDTEEETISGEEKQQESSGMAIKLGVGVALLVVAHLVLVRKWRSAPVEKRPEDIIEVPSPVKSRRNTIVAPPPLQEVEPDIEQDEEDYSDEEISSDEEETQSEPKSAKTRYQELRSTYTRSLTPDGEIDYHKEPEVEDDEEYDDEEDEEISEEEDEEEGDTDNEDYDEDEDEELLKRLEEKYGKLHGDKRGASAKDADDSDPDDYEHANVTNKEDYKIKEKIDEAQKSVQNNSAYAIKLYDNILQIYPLSPRSIYGKALALDHLADQRRSNEILEEALQYYLRLFSTPNVPDTLFQIAAERCINRMRFVGQYRNAINVHWKLIKKFPADPQYLNNLAVTYLTVNRVEEARAVLIELLSKWPEDGLALVHYGFILKTTDNNLEAAVAYLKKGLDTKANGVIDGRFYFHLGDALARLGRTEEAMKVYEDGVKNNVFLSKYQRSLYNVPRLTGKPWWELEELPYQDLYRVLTQNWRKIRDEGLAVLNEKAYFQDESENLKDVGDWKQFELFARGQKNVNNCIKCPFTCSIIEKIPEARGCKRGQTKFSVMHPGTHVWPHCGPTNCRLRLHLGLKVPPKTFIRVADVTRSWKEGKMFVFDDSFEHEVWHNGTDFRLVLIVDVWHPELTSTEKRNLSPI